MIRIIPCTCVAGSLLIYLIGCWQSPPLTLVNEMRLWLGLQCLVAMVWIRFMSCCLAIPRVSWLSFLSTLATRGLKYNETEAGQRRTVVPEPFLPSHPAMFLNKCVASKTVKWDLKSYRLVVFILGLRMPMCRMENYNTHLLEWLCRQEKQIRLKCCKQ